MSQGKASKLANVTKNLVMEDCRQCMIMILKDFSIYNGSMYIAHLTTFIIFEVITIRS